MTVQYALGPVTVGPLDFVRTDRGITWTIKCRDIDTTQVVFALIKQADGSWATNGSPDSILDDSFDLKVKPDTDMLNWLKTVLIPKLNKWLAFTFPATNTVNPPTTFANKLEEADHLINSVLKITVNADGTITAGV